MTTHRLPIADPDQVLIDFLRSEVARLRSLTLEQAATIEALSRHASRTKKIRTLLELGSPVNASLLSKSFKCSVKSIQRDVEFLRASLRMPISFDFSRNTFYLNGGTPK